MSDTGWRLLLDSPQPGAWNMAVDEALLDEVAAGGIPTLRFYAWSPPCLSLGYFQRFEVVDTDGCRSLGVDIVRRPTGGRAILHDRELTYSLTLPADRLGHDAGVLPSYYRISRALQAGLAALGVATTMAPESAAARSLDAGPICFDRPSAHEILLFGRKLVGSAQVRRENAILQHGSILIEPRLERLAACLRLPAGTAGSLVDGVVGLAEIGMLDTQQLARALSDAVAREFGVGMVPGRLAASEKARATGLMADKYQSIGWTERPLETTPLKTTRTR
ncbi:MAG TPA: lipoate--protein ligase family protein [Candidatus Dormibacteraeota bacterium]|nr:lipoate--protein ligase family protein [Candidatus Dormibacteraeota bacterium]